MDVGVGSSLRARAGVTHGILLIVTATVLGSGCDDNEDLRQIERGTDHRPGVEGSPPEEGN